MAGKGNGEGHDRVEKCKLTLERKKMFSETEVAALTAALEIFARHAVQPGQALVAQRRIDQGERVTYAETRQAAVWREAYAAVRATIAQHESLVI